MSNTVFINIVLVIGLLSYFVTVFYSLKHQLHMAQQNSYMPVRYYKWAKNHYFKNGKLLSLLPLISVLLIIANTPLAAFMSWILFYVLIWFRLKSQKHKKKLVFTARATRIFVVSLALYFIVTFIVWQLASNIAFVFGLFVFYEFFSGAFTIVAIFLLAPVEKKINKWYYNDAKRILNAMPHLKIIGITGSYGKTSTKHYLHTILSEKFNVLMTPGSYNTTMGVIKTIRMYLKPIHEVFIVEMGAKQIGDINEICKLVTPKIGILTAVAGQHLETFKTIENVKRTKFELIDSLPQDGLAILNADFDIIRKTKIKSDLNYIYYSANEETDFYATELEYSGKGMTFKLINKKQIVTDVETRLLGEHNVSNIVASCATAVVLDVPPELIKRGVKRIEPVSHRLEIKRNPNGVTIIDDAFNSNPTGAKIALEVLHKIEGNKKIIVTPGMIELGVEEEILNRKFGEQIAEVCDFVVLVGPKQTKPILDGIININGDKSKVFVAKNLTEATQKLNTMIQVGDVVLYENDLPDTFNE